MIQVPNPNTANGQRPTMYVFRPWNLQEAASAVAGIPSPEEDPEEWVTNMTDLIHSYRLNGHEAGEAIQSALGRKWAKVKGNYTGRADDGTTYSYPEDGTLTGGYKDNLDALFGRIKTTFTKRADYAHIAAVKQKPGGVPDDFKARMENVFRANSGSTHDEDQKKCLPTTAQTSYNKRTPARRSRLGAKTLYRARYR